MVVFLTILQNTAEYLYVFSKVSEEENSGYVFQRKQMVLYVWQMKMVTVGVLMRV